MKMFELLPRPLGSIFRKLTHQTCNSRAAKLAAGREDWSWLDEGIFQVKPSLATMAMGEREQKPAGLAAAVEKREALRPWTKKQSPADLAKPIAFDAADMVMFWRAVSGSLRNPHVQKGERIKGRPSAIGLNVGGDRIEIVSKLFGVIDASDIKTLREACKADGFFQNEDPDWAAKRSKASVQAEIDRSNAELDKRTRELFRKRVETGEGGEHYATQVLGHEIGHTLGLLPAGAQLGPVGNAAMTLYKAMEREWKRQISGTRQIGEAAKNVKGEITRLIAWWHGQETMPDYYRKPNEMFAELFGIFLTQPESVQAMAPHAYDACVKIVAGNDKLAAAYRKIAGLKWSGKSNDRVMDEVRKTWEKEAQDQYRKLRQMSRESVSLKRDWFSYALNDRFGPMFNIARRGLAAEKKLLKEAVRTGAMSEAEAKDRLAEKEAEINALKTSLYDWQRQSGGQTRLMIAEFDEVRDAAERDGTSWNDVRDYAHLMRVIELGGRATAHGMDPARASATLEDMQKRMGAAAFAEMHADLRQTMEMLKGNMFLPTARAYGNRETEGFANDMMNKAGFRMVEQMRRQASKSRFGRAVDIAKSPLERNRLQQEYEDVLAKAIAYLHDRAVYGTQRSVEESGLTVKRNVSIAEGERKGSESRTIQRYMTQFFNMTEKGVMRTVRAVQERPGETLGKMARTWVGRFVGSAMTYGLVTRAIRALFDDDEEKAKASPLGEVYGFAKWIERANKNLSNYVRNHYQTIPLWVSDDGYTTIVLGTPLNDEDSLIAPSADFAAKAFANAMGAKNDLALGQMLADTFIRPVTPDLAIATPALKVIRDTIEATMVQNPTDLFTGAPTYDRDLYALRNESWETRGDFALAMARQVYNDVGARGFMAVDRQGVDNGTGAAPKWIGLALKRIPVLSPVLNSFVKVQVGSPEKDARPIRADEQRLQHVRNYISRKLMTESASMGGALNRTDPKRYAELLEGWQQEYGLSDHDMWLVEKRFLNGWTEYENEEARRRKVIQGTLRKARKLGIEEAERLMICGEL